MTPLKSAIAFILALLAVPAVAGSPVLGDGKGLDHMGIAVHDLDRAVRDFGNLGFDVKPGGRFPGGVSNAIDYFGDGFYLELITVAADHSKDNDDIADFLKKHEGAIFLGLNTSSAKSTADFLRAHNFDVMGPEPGSIMTGKETKPPPPMWYSAYTPDKPAKGKEVFALPIFFIQYTPLRGFHVKPVPQPNTAYAVRAVWFTAHDLKGQLKNLSDGGFAAPAGKVSLLNLKGERIPAGRGDLNLLQTPKSEDKLIAFAGREDGIFAISFLVKDLAKAHALAEAAVKGPLRMYDGPYGKSFVIPSGLAHGVWIEMVQG